MILLEADDYSKSKGSLKVLSSPGRRLWDFSALGTNTVAGSSCGRKKKVGLSKGKNWAPSLSIQRHQLTKMETLKLGWPFWVAARGLNHYSLILTCQSNAHFPQEVVLYGTNQISEAEVNFQRVLRAGGNQLWFWKETWATSQHLLHPTPVPLMDSLLYHSLYFYPQLEILQLF